MSPPRSNNPRGPAQRFPSSLEPITRDPKSVDQSHQDSDINSSIFAQHHSLGPNPNQASPGNHVHDGSTSKELTDLLILNNLNVVNLLTAGNLAWGQVNITPSGTGGVPTSAAIAFNLKGTTFVGFVTANSTVPGTSIQGVSISSVTATTALVWLTRSTVVATGIFWLVIGI